MHKILLISVMVLISLLSNSNFCLAYEKEIKSLSSTIVENITKAGKKTVAVVDFTDLQGNVTELGRFLAEELSVDLTVSAKGFEVIDRTHLKSILTEHKLSISGLVDPNTVKKLGKIAGVDAIVTGSVTPFGDSIRVSAKVIATDTARVIAAAKGDIAKTKAIEELLAKGIETGVPTSVTPLPTPPAKAKWKIESQGFTFELQRCKISGQGVTCDLLVTSNEQDRIFRLCKEKGVLDINRCKAGSKMFDDIGNEYKVTRGQVADKTEWISDISFGGSTFIDSRLISGVPTKVNLRFDNISPTAKMIALLEFWFGYCDGCVVQFRNIPLSR